MLLPQEGSLSIHTSLPASGDGSSPVMAVVRLLAEIRTRSDFIMSVSGGDDAVIVYGLCLFCVFVYVRACLVMAQLLEDSSFCEEFIQQCPAAVEVLNLIAQECSPGELSSLTPIHPKPSAGSEGVYTMSLLYYDEL